MRDSYNKEMKLLALRCWKVDDITEKDIPIIIIIGKNGQTLDAIKHENIKTDGDIHKFKHFMYNEIPVYDITISEKEYKKRFTPIAKAHENI